ncbi:MAG: DUF4135 domain-containing protein, partial [Bacteroidota bacterium]
MPKYQLTSPHQKHYYLPEINVVCTHRAAIYNACLLQAFDTMQSLVKTGKFYSALMPGVNLLEGFAKILDEYTISGVMADFLQCRPYLFQDNKPPVQCCVDGTNVLIESQFFDQREVMTVGTDDWKVTTEQAYLNYFNWAINHDIQDKQGKTVDGIDAFLSRNCRTSYILDKVTTHFTTNLQLLIQRLTNDWDLISAFFFDFEDGLLLRKVENTSSDFHRGGQQVFILTFSNHQKLVYKPTDIEIDSVICGKISGLRSSVVDHLNQQIGKDLEDLKQKNYKLVPDRSKYFLPAHSIYEEMNSQTEMKLSRTYKILPRYQGSLFLTDTKNHPNIPVNESYGYIQYLSHDSEDYEKLNTEEIKKYFHSWGFCAAIAGVFSISDLHVDNVITHKKQPYFIDLETSFVAPSNSMKNTFVFVKNDPEGLSYGGLNGNFTQEPSQYFRINDATGLLKVDPVTTQQATQITKNFATDVYGKRLDYTQYKEKLLQGFSCALNAITPQSFLFVSAVARNCIGRYIPNNPRYDKKALSFLYGYKSSRELLIIDNDKDRALSTIAVEIDAEFVDSSVEQYPWNDIVRSPLQWGKLNGRLVWTGDNSYQDLLNCDLPAYSHRVDESNLYNSSGNLV